MALGITDPSPLAGTAWSGSDAWRECTGQSLARFHLTGWNVGRGSTLVFKQEAAIAIGLFHPSQAGQRVGVLFRNRDGTDLPRRPLWNHAIANVFDFRQIPAATLCAMSKSDEYRANA